MCVRACMRACMRACVRACVRAWVGAWVGACVHTIKVLHSYEAVCSTYTLLEH